MSIDADIADSARSIVAWIRDGEYDEAFKHTMMLAQLLYERTALRNTAVASRKQLRAPMRDHKESLIGFLLDGRSATRAQIVAQTGIPMGSLSQLLSEPEFEQVERGLWRLRQP